MAFIEGQPLSDVTRKDPQWSATQIADTVCRIALALDVAHRAGIIHRDLKPANIMIDPDGDPIVMDFGLACYMHAEEQVPLTLDGAVLGTPSYMSPEQLRKELGKVGPASDIYALGVIMYELLTGQRPFSGPMLMLLLDVVNEQKTPPKPSEIRPGCHPQLEAICLKMLSKSLTDRHRSMKEVAAELTHVLKTGLTADSSATKTAEPQTSPITNGPGSTGGRRRTLLKFVLGGFAAMVMLGLIVIRITNKDGKETVVTVPEGTPIELQTEPGDKVSITRKADAATAAILISPEALKYDWPTDAPKPAIAPFDAAQARAYQEAWAKHLGVPVEHTNSIGMKFVLIPPGEFMMGSPPAELEEALRNVSDWYWLACINSEAPQRKVILTQPIYLGMHEVTQGDYEQVMGTNPSAFSPAGVENARVAGINTTRHPVEQVSWLDAAEFCGKLSQQEKLKPHYLREADTVTLLEGNGYRLPSDAGWEFACRAGTMTKYWIGDNNEDLMNTDVFSLNSEMPPQAVGKMKANPFGLFDMHGNIAEWMEDGMNLAYYVQFHGQLVIDPLSPFSAITQRMRRGGDWYNSHLNARSAFRYADSAITHYSYNGFRVSLTVDAVKTAIHQPAPQTDAL